MATNVIVLASYFCLWAAFHSLLASLRVKSWARRAIGARTSRWYRLVFNAIAGLTILPWLALVPNRTLYTIPFPFCWATMAGQALALGAMLWTLIQTGVGHFLGLTQLLGGSTGEDSPLQIRGFYCHMRHPLYFFALLFLWLTPIMTGNIMTANAVITVYFWLGSVLEEKKLLIEFGEAYAHYQRHVPRLIPRLRRCYPPAANSAETPNEEMP
jgi:protein-S-isoprenylcysteine O-methyltransferase Ste14